MLKQTTKNKIKTTLTIILSVIGLLFVAEHNKAAHQNKRLNHVIQVQDNIIQKYKRERTHIVTMSMFTARPRETKKDPRFTATNARVTVGRTLAVSRDLSWMLGHKVYIHGQGVFVVEDLMHPRWRNKIDLLVSDVKTALKFGTKDVKIEVLGKET